MKDCQDVCLSVPSCFNMHMWVWLRVCVQVCMQMCAAIRGQFRGHPENHHPILLYWSWSSPLGQAGRVLQGCSCLPLPGDYRNTGQCSVFYMSARDRTWALVVVRPVLYWLNHYPLAQVASAFSISLHRAFFFFAVGNKFGEMIKSRQISQSYWRW